MCPPWEGGKRNNVVGASRWSCVLPFFEHKTTGIIHATIVKLSFPEVGHDIMQVVKEDELSFGHVTARIHARLKRVIEKGPHLMSFGCAGKVKGQMTFIM